MACYSLASSIARRVTLPRLHALAWSLTDMQPSPAPVRTGAQSGESPSAWALCSSCDGQGFVTDRYGRPQPCTECDTRGRFRVDPFTQQRVQGLDSTAPPRGRRAGCDRCGSTGVMPGRYVGEQGLVRCETCDGSGHVTVPFDENTHGQRPILDGSPLGRQRARGDWDALERLLGEMAVFTPKAWRLFVHGRVLCIEEPSLELGRLEHGMLRHLPLPLRCPADIMLAYDDRARRQDLADKARAQRMVTGKARVRKARELVALGYSQTQVADMLGISQNTVSRYCRAA